MRTLLRSSNGAALIAILHACNLRADSKFYSVGYTWRHAGGSTARIDYVCADLDAAGECVHAESPACVDLSLAAGEDHRCVCVVRQRGARAGGQGQADVPHEQVEARRPRMCRQDLLGAGGVRSPQKRHGTIDDKVDHVVGAMQRAARRGLGPMGDCPRKRWILPATWALIETQKLNRRLGVVAVLHRNGFRLARAWSAWKEAVPRAYVPGCPLPALGWGTSARRAELRMRALAWNLAWNALCATTQRAGMLLGALIQIVMACGRQIYLESRAAGR